MPPEPARLWCVQVTSPGCESVAVFDDRAEAVQQAALRRLKYGESHVRAWELTAPEEKRGGPARCQVFRL